MKHELLKQIIPSGGSLGSWVDEKRSQLRDLMRIADTLSIDILNAHGGIGVSIPMPRLFEGCTSKESQLPFAGLSLSRSEVCVWLALGVKDWCAVDVLPSGFLTILESRRWLSGCIELCSCLSIETVLVVALSSNLPHCDKCRRSLSSVIHTCTDSGGAGEDGWCFCKFNLESDVTTR
jgi:hypothetical protein